MASFGNRNNYNRLTKVMTNNIQLTTVYNMNNYAEMLMTGSFMQETFFNRKLDESYDGFLVFVFWVVVVFFSITPTD